MVYHGRVCERCVGVLNQDWLCAVQSNWHCKRSNLFRIETEFYSTRIDFGRTFISELLVIHEGVVHLSGRIRISFLP